MSMTQTGVASGERVGYAGFADALGGIATVVLAIVGLSGYAENMMLSIATLVFAVALLIEGEAILTEFARMVFPAGTTADSGQIGAGGVSAILLAGAAGVVLGILALLGIHAAVLTSVAIIAFGGALALGGDAASNLQFVKMRFSQAASPALTGGDLMAAEMASGSANVQAIVGLAAIILGILAVVGTANATILALVALLALGAALVLTGTTLSGVVLRFARPASATISR